MASLIPGYNYDIFISYRQKDNKYDGWVTEFVDNLKKEIEATFKEDVSVYFDINPHDGLLETHDVDASLKEKLKCLVFIPIISRTYCDPKSFAWEHEFKLFVEQASQDQFGLKVKLPNGNIASRFLPVRIHDLDIVDIKECESLLGGVLRGIEFIYKSAGVNRPLRANEDHPQDNLNKTYYRDQINKVANAIKEDIAALKKQSQHPEEVQRQAFDVKPAIQKNNRTKLGIAFALIITLIILGCFFIPKLFKPVEKSIAVLPFTNLSNDPEQEYFSDGMVDAILDRLFKVGDLKVIARTSSMRYKNTKLTLKEISRELGVSTLLEGSVQKIGNKVRITAQLIDPVTSFHLWSETFDKDLSDVFSIQSEVAQNVATELKAVLTPDQIKKIAKKPTENLEAYNHYLQGNFYLSKSYASQDWKEAINLYKKAIELDPDFALAYTKLATSYLNQYWFYQDRSESTLHISKQLIEKAFVLDPDLPEAHLALGTYYYDGYLDYSKALEQCNLVLKEQPGNPDAMYLSASIYRRAGNWEKAKSTYLKAFDLDPRSTRIAFNTGETFDLLRDYSKAEKFCNMAIMLQPDWMNPYQELSRLFLQREGDTKKAREILDNAIINHKSLLSDSLIVESKILIDIYEGKFENAIKNLSLCKSDVFQTQFYYRPKSLYYARIYDLMNKPEFRHAYYDSTRILLEKKINEMPEDSRFYSAIGIAYAGLGYKEKALAAGEKAVEIMPIEKEAYKGTYRIEDLARINVMVIEYTNAMEQIKLLLSIPGPISTKLLLLDPAWKPLWDLPEFKKIIRTTTLDVKYN
jgi:TolB-like protein/Flp pilus assembly protein TadD